jgi:hypothetical protein
MKKWLFLLLAAAFAGCHVSEDCFKKSGAIREKDFAVPGFYKIYVYPNISLVVSEGDGYSAHVEAGENVIDEISVEVKDSVLSLRDNSGCNLSRQYGGKTVFVTTPHLQTMEIFSNTAQSISSAGALTHDVIRLYAMDYFGGVGTGDFDLDVENRQLVVQSNNISRFTISGHTDEMLLDFYNDLSRFEGAGFPAGHIGVFQRSSNDMIIMPTDSLTGDIYSTGNVICKSHPPLVNVTRHYSGRVIFED